MRRLRGIRFQQVSGGGRRIISWEGQSEDKRSRKDLQFDSNFAATDFLLTLLPAEAHLPVATAYAAVEAFLRSEAHY